MKRIGLAVLVLAMIVVIAAPVVLTGQQCPAAKDRVLLYSTGHYLFSQGQPIGPGFDPFGYNYQAHLFNGYYGNVYLGADNLPPFEGDLAAYFAANPTAASKWYASYIDTILLMKWNDAWIANTDCDNDGKLDRHYGSTTYRGSGAWETNHMKGTYIQDGKKCEWTYFCKIVAVPLDAIKKADGNWYTLEDKLIGPDIWGEFAIIEEVSNDPCAGINGRSFISPLGPGFGKF